MQPMAGSAAATPRFRNSDKLQVLSHREWMRQHMPAGSEGYVVEDLDLVLRVYGPGWGTDSVGKFMLLELKFGKASIGAAQRKTFGLMDSLIKTSPLAPGRYLGYFVVNYSDEDWGVASFIINGVPLTRPEWLAFVRFDDGIVEKILANGTSPLDQVAGTPSRIPPCT